MGKSFFSKIKLKFGFESYRGEDISHFLSLSIPADNLVKIKHSSSEALPKKLIGMNFSFKTVMLIGTIDCDIEGKISRRYMMDLMHRKINRSNVLTNNDLEKFNMCQVHCI